jgi:ATP-binding cassette subfamily B protein
MFIGYLRRFFEPVHRFSEELSTFQRAFSGAQRVFELLDAELEVMDKAAAKKWGRLEKAVEFQNVWFSYGDGNGKGESGASDTGKIGGAATQDAHGVDKIPGTATQDARPVAPDKDDWVLREINFTVPRGERWALVGATGGGKTSIISLLLRFYQPQKGRILVDGIDINDIRQTELRSRIGLVLQDIFLFPGNVLENLRMGDERITPERVMEAARRLGMDDVIRRLPKGLDTQLAERGENLSTGERQLLSFLRAMLVDPDILVLDEATSSVDPQTERLLQRAMAELLAGRTSVVIAHRLSTVMDSDNILVIHNGRITERGRHEELLAQGGYYSKLFMLQSLAAREEEEELVPEVGNKQASPASSGIGSHELGSGGPPAS